MAQQEGRIGPPYNWEPADNTPVNLERCEAYTPNAERDFTKYLDANKHPLTKFFASLLPSKEASENRLKAHLETTEEAANNLKIYWMQPVLNHRYHASAERNLVHGALKEHLKEKPRQGTVDAMLFQYSK
mmetsp:Transcript_30872/g.84466  ORF Transcript_30872/g.84466 Transcript_30872/m.84466 type:complete len:130 (+) Transcript_30872:58-447(+)